MRNNEIKDLLETTLEIKNQEEFSSKSTKRIALTIEEAEFLIEQSLWISVADSLPETYNESEEDPDKEGYPRYHGYVSSTYEVTDATYCSHGLGHYRDDGKWVIYQGEHDFQNVDPDKVKFYKPVSKLP